MNKHRLTVDVMSLLARIRADTSSPEEKELLEVAIHAILFITSTGQRYAFSDFLAHLESDDPPPVVASFSTREEADTWLNHHPEPPDSTCILIADQYHLVLFIREMDHRRLIPHPVLEHHLGRLEREGVAPAVASFETHEAAEAWFKSQAQPARQAVIQIAGEPYLAVYHPNIDHRAIYPFSMAIEDQQDER